MTNKLLLILMIFLVSCSLQGNKEITLNENDQLILDILDQKYDGKIKFTVKDNYVSKIKLTKMGMMNSLPEELSRFEQLDSLYIYKTSFEDKKIDVRKVKTLKYIGFNSIDLSDYNIYLNNKIEDILLSRCAFTKYPEAISKANIKKLEIGGFSTDYQKIFPMEIGGSALKEVIFHYVDFEKLPDIKTPNELSLSVIQHDNIVQLPESYLHHKYKMLIISGCKK
ncbi:hypothetical protein, partial [Flammeovirga aprica]